MSKITLKAARVNAGFTQSEVAKLLNISNTTLCKWENGISYPKQPAIEQLCSLYGITYDFIDFAPVS